MNSIVIIIKYPKIISNGELVNSEFPDYKNGNFQYEHENGKYYIYTDENGKQVSDNNVSYYIDESPGNDDGNIYYTTPIIYDNFTVYYPKYNKSLKDVKKFEYLLGSYVRITKFGEPDKGFTITNNETADVHTQNKYSKDYPFYVNTTSNPTMYIYYNIKRNEWSWSSNYTRYEYDENNEHSNYNYLVSKNIPTINHAYYQNDIKKIIEDYYFHYTEKIGEISISIPYEISNTNMNIMDLDLKNVKHDITYDINGNEISYKDPIIAISFYAHGFIYDVKKKYKIVETFGELKEKLLKDGILKIKSQTRDAFGDSLNKEINKEYKFEEIQLVISSYDENYNLTQVTDNDEKKIIDLYKNDDVDDFDPNNDIEFRCTLKDTTDKNITYFIEEDKNNDGKYNTSIILKSLTDDEIENLQSTIIYPVYDEKNNDEKNKHSLIEPLELTATNYISNSNSKILTFNIVNNNTNTTNPDGSIYIGFNNAICYQLDKYHTNGYYLNGNNYEFDLTSSETDIIDNNDNKSFSIKDKEIDNGTYKLNINTPTGTLTSQVFLIKENKLVIPFTVNITKYENNNLYFKIKNNTDTDLIISSDNVMYAYLYKNVSDYTNDSMEIKSVNIENNSESEFNIDIDNTPTNGDKYKIEVYIPTPYENIISEWYTINSARSTSTTKIFMNNIFSMKMDKNSKSIDTTIFNKIRHKKKIH